MLTHLKPQEPKKGKKIGRAQNTVKRGTFWRGRGRRQGARPLSPTERRELPYFYATARGPLAGFVAPEGRKVGSLKRRVRSQLARWEMKICTPLWREAHLQVKKLKAPHVPSTFGSWAVQKVHAVVARSTFASEKAKNTSRSDHRPCGAKHICKWKS